MEGNLGSSPFGALSSLYPCAHSPGLLDCDGRLSDTAASAAVAAAVAAAPAAPTVRALGQGLRVAQQGSREPDASVPRAVVGAGAGGKLGHRMGMELELLGS